MRSAFTLIEVVAAAAIASIAGIALLQMNSQSTFLFSKAKQTAMVAERLSIVGNHADARFAHTTKSLYTILGDTYRIENDDLRKWLDAQRIDYEERLVDTIRFDSDDDGSGSDEPMTYEEEADAAAAPVLQFELIQVSMKQDEDHGAVLITRPLF